MAASVLTIAANPAILSPPNGRLVPVQVSGVIADTDAPDIAANFRVIDEYGAVQPSGPVALRDNGDGTFAYNFTVQLQARRLGQDRDGRQYIIVVDAFDNEAPGSASTVVTVPHDRGRRAGFGPNRGRRDDGPSFDGDDNDDRGRRFDSPRRGRGRGARDLVFVGRDDDRPDRDLDDGPGRGQDKNKDKSKDRDRD